MALNDLFSARRRREELADRLYGQLVKQARQPGLYAACGVPDTLDGRFEALVLHLFLLLHRLKGEGHDLRALGAAIGERMIVDFDENLREMGVGDLSVGKKVTFMAEATYGRIAAYDSGLAAGQAALEAALRRNLFGTLANPDAAAIVRVTAYVRRVVVHLASQPLADIAAGRLDFGPPPNDGEA
jgi:cytochrome b pre-mRNA-processing protein 3